MLSSHKFYLSKGEIVNPQMKVTLENVVNNLFKLNDVSLSIKVVDTAKIHGFTGSTSR